MFLRYQKNSNGHQSASTKYADFMKTSGLGNSIANRQEGANFSEMGRIRDG